MWQGDDDHLPESWFGKRKSGRGKIKEDYAAHRPQRLWVAADGRINRVETPGAVGGWFAPRPFAICLRCRSVYDLRPNAEFGRLSTLSQTGRSTATTILSGAIVAGLGRDGGVEEDSRKVLSFTDNRQDASFQAGHINDFSQVALLRSAVFRAVAAHQRLGLGDLGAKAFDALGLAPELFMKTPADPRKSWVAPRPQCSDRAARVSGPDGPCAGLENSAAEPRTVRIDRNRVRRFAGNRGQQQLVGESPRHGQRDRGAA